MEPTSDILTARAHVEAGFSGMVATSVGIHLVALTVFLSMPSGARPNPPHTVIDINFSSAPGADNGGATTIGRQAVQVIRTPHAKPVSATPQAANPFEQTSGAQEKHAASIPRVSEAPPEARSRTPVSGEQLTQGHAIAETAATSINVGLATGGAGASGHLDLTDFCCPEYLSTLVQLIQRNWIDRQAVSGQTQIGFTVARDGRIADVSIERSSGYFALDQTAERAVRIMGRLPPLPAEYTEPQLAVHLVFRYAR